MKHDAGRATLRSLSAFGLCWMLALNQIRATMDNWGNFIFRHPGFADFGSYYSYARLGLQLGWNRLYDLAAQRQEWLAMGGPHAMPFYPIIYPPPLAWLVVPFTALPLPAAYACWTLLLLGLLLITVRLVAPFGAPLTTWTVLGAILAIFPVLFALVLGQVLILELASVAAAWWLLRRGKEIPAGILLVTLVFKPQVAFLLPVVLLVLGRWRTVLTWLAGSILVAAVALVTTGLSGMQIYAERLLSAAAVAPQFVVPTQFTVRGLLRGGVPTLVAEAVVVGFTLWLAYRHRRAGIDLPIAAALVGSILATPYLHDQDLAVLLLAGGISLYAPVSRWQRRLLAAGYVLLLAISYWGFGPPGLVLGPMLVMVEAAWLAASIPAARSGRGAELVMGMSEVPLDRTA